LFVSSTLSEARAKLTALAHLEPRAAGIDSAGSRGAEPRAPGRDWSGV
jgi:hypothetical protein